MSGQRSPVLDSTIPYRDLLFSMKRLRFIEEAIAHNYPDGKMRCPVHLSIGQEAVSAAVGAVLRKTDYAVSGHRAHTHYLGKGGSMKRMLAEIYGKQTGCSSGKGGSMHLIDEEVGFKGSTAIVGGTIPVGTGLGLSISLHKTDQISVVFLGDGAVEEGVFFESANFAALRKLPVLFVCENNQYSVYSHLRVRQPEGRKIHKMVEAIGLATATGNGNDAVEVYKICRDAVSNIRAGSGPRFLEFETYRWREHCGPNFDNDIGYRTEAEFESWKKREPIEPLLRFMIENQLLSSADVEEMDRKIENETKEAFAFAESSPFPELSETFQNIYHDGNRR